VLSNISLSVSGLSVIGLVVHDQSNLGGHFRDGVEQYTVLVVREFHRLLVSHSFSRFTEIINLFRSPEQTGHISSHVRGNPFVSPGLPKFDSKAKCQH
jgi:hypothetical protein